MKPRNAAQDATLPLPGIPKKAGRPRKPGALSNAERQRRHRQKCAKVETGERMAATIKRLADQFDLSEAEVTRHLIRFALCNRNWTETGFPSGR